MGRSKGGNWVFLWMGDASPGVGTGDFVSSEGLSGGAEGRFGGGSEGRDKDLVADIGVIKAVGLMCWRDSLEDVSSTLKKKKKKNQIFFVFFKFRNDHQHDKISPQQNCLTNYQLKTICTGNTICTGKSGHKSIYPCAGQDRSNELDLE